MTISFLSICFLFRHKEKYSRIQTQNIFHVCEYKYTQKEKIITFNQYNKNFPVERKKTHKFFRGWNEIKSIYHHHISCACAKLSSLTIYLSFDRKRHKYTWIAKVFPLSCCCSVVDMHAEESTIQHKKKLYEGDINSFIRDKTLYFPSF